MSRLGGQATKQIQQMLREHQRRMRNPRPQRARWQPVGSSGGGADIIIFSIEEANCETRTAIGSVVRVMCGNTSLDAGQEVYLYDETGCNLTGDENLLVGLKGWAAKMDGGPYGCEWVIINLCCNGFSC